MRRIPLQLFLFVCLGLTAALPALVLGAVQTERWGAEQVSQAERENQLAAQLLAEDAGQLMATHVREVESLARQVEARGHGSLQPAELQPMLAAQRASSLGLMLMYVGDRRGVGLAVDPPLNADNRPAAGTDFSDRDYYRELVRTGRTAMSRAQLGKNTRRPSVQIGTPIWNTDDGSLVGFAEGSVDLGEIQLLADRIGASHPGLKAVVLDGEGRVLAHPDPKLREVMADLGEIALFQPGQADRELRVAADEVGTPYRAAVVSIRERGLNWSVVVGRREADFGAYAQAAQRQTLEIVFVALGMSLLLAAILATLIARPIAGLTAAADAVAHGDFTRPLPRLRWWFPREVHTQVVAVRRMIDRLRARTEQLEHQVTSRTRDLQEAQQRYQSLFAENPDAVFALDLDARITSLNAACEQMSGHAADELLGRAFADLLTSPDDAASVLADVLQGHPRNFETTVAHRHGHPVAVHVTALPIVVGGRILGAYGIAKDITERKHAEHALARSEERFRGLVQNGAELIVVLGTDGTVQYASPSVESLLGIPGDEATGAKLARYVHPEEKLPFKHLLEEALRSPRVNLTEAFRMRHSDGQWRHVEAVCRNLTDVPEIGGLVLNVRDVSERKALEDELAYRAYHDSLTELPNRALLTDRLAQALARGTRNGRRTAVLFVDLDAFKVINDSLGHRQGDQMLVCIAQRLRASVRPGDTVARLGGDEFVVLLEDIVDEEDATQVAERVLEQLKRPLTLGERELYIGASIGIAVSGPQPTLADDLLRDADMAMYAAKNRGKGLYAVFEPDMSSQPLERLELEADLRRALERDELRLHYQPILELETGRLNGVEALLRWQHPTRGLVAPLQFVPLAEETGLIVPIGRWVLEEACQQASAWHAVHPSGPPLVMSVNISGRQFRDPALVEDVANALRASGLAPERLRLEITESVAMEAGMGTIQTLQALKGLGVHLAIDDFGTGYSSLSYLKRFPVDTLKIDRSFVDGLGEDSQDTAIVRTVITIAKMLNLGVTAEGIETLEQLNELRSLECDEGQGFYFARPAPSQALERLVEVGRLETEADEESDRLAA